MPILVRKFIRELVGHIHRLDKGRQMTGKKEIATQIAGRGFQVAQLVVQDAALLPKLGVLRLQHREKIHHLRGPRSIATIELHPAQIIQDPRGDGFHAHWLEHI